MTPEVYREIFYSKNFAEWAFGPDFYDLDELDMPSAWNKLHADVFEVQMSGDKIKDKMHMVDAYINHLKQISKPINKEIAQ